MLAVDLILLTFVYRFNIFQAIILFFIFDDATNNGSILNSIMNDTAIDRAPMSVIFLFEAIDFVLLVFVPFVLVANSSPLHVILMFEPIDFVLLVFVPFVLVANGSPLHVILMFEAVDLMLLHAVNHIVAADRSVLHAVHYFARFDLSLLHAVNHVVAVDGSPLAVIHRVLFVVFDCALIKSLFQIFDSRTILFNLFILPSFMHEVKSNIRRDLCPAQGQQDGAGEERGEDGAFQRAAGLFLLTSAPPPLCDCCG